MTPMLWMHAHRRSLLFLCLILALGGIAAAFGLPVSLFPDVAFPRVQVTLDAGDRPADQMVLQVTTPLEEAIRRVLSWVPAGSSGRVCPTAALTSRNARLMSTPQSNVTAISALPRLVVERTSRTSRTRRIASSSGVVTCSTIWSPGRSPASRVTCTRGKATSGNSETGRPNAAAIPPSVRIRHRNSSDRRCECIHSVGVMAFSSLPPAGAPRRRRSTHRRRG